MGKIRPNMREICMKIKKSWTNLDKNLGRQKKKSVKNKVGNKY